MFQLPNKQEMQELRANDTPYSVSMYVPYIEPSGGMSNPNWIEFKNILRDAEVALSEAGADGQTIAQTLQPGYDLLEQNDFWPSLHTSLAVFAHKDFFRYYHIPQPKVEFLVSVEKGFWLEPLEQIIANDTTYLVLALSHHGVQLYQGDKYTVHQVQVDDLSKSLQKALMIDEKPRSLEQHTVAPASRGKYSETFHGQYNQKEVDKQWLVKYFRMIDEALHDFLRGKETPLVLAGVEYLHPIYREVNTYPHLIKKGLTGNFEHAKPEEIRDKARQLLE